MQNVEKELFMGQLLEEASYFLANTKKQSLSQHLFAVGYVAYYLLDELGINHRKLKQAAFLSGIMHDLGKVDPKFQDWVKKKTGKIPEDYIPEDGVHIDSPKKFSFEKYPRHHEISWLLVESLLTEAALNSEQLKQISHGVYWHHSKPFRKDDIFTKSEAIFCILKKSLGNDKFDDVYDSALAVLKDVWSMVNEEGTLSNLLPKLSTSFSLTKNQLPQYKNYNDCNDQVEEFKTNIKQNALNNLVRTAVISADRLVSSCTAKGLQAYIAEKSLRSLLEKQDDESELLSEIDICLNGFKNRYPNSKRNESQTKAATALAEIKKFPKINESANIAVLQGPAGCGKTKLALEWASLTDVKKIIWVCPRVQVCLGLVNDLTDKEYLPHSRIEIFTGEYKKIVTNGANLNDMPDTDKAEYFSGDIVITTIDQVVNSMITHHKVETLVDFMGSHVVFDEFHELINMSAFNLLFAELIEAKKTLGDNANTLLVSATPNNFFVEKFLGISKEDIIATDSFNHSKYKIEFISYNEKEDNTNPLLKIQQEKNTFVITNTALDAQLGFIKHHISENNVLLHSKYTKQDKLAWFNKVFESFKKGGNHRYDVLRSGPIVQASLNITCDKMLTEITSAENWLQRLGRLDRFGENSEINPYITVLPESISQTEKLTSSCAQFLNRLSVFQSTKAWYEFLQNRLNAREYVSINELYKIYQDFYKNDTALESIKLDFISALKKSTTCINKKIIDPISVPSKSKNKDGIIKISANSLRGNNCFVQMAVCEVGDKGSITFRNEYAYNESFDASNPPYLTASVDSIRGYGNDNNNLVQFMRNKHHNIKKAEGYKQARNEWELIKQARSPEFPIYLSYTPEDLECVGGQRVAHPHAVYYVKSQKQPIGAISINQLNRKVNNNKEE